MAVIIRKDCPPGQNWPPSFIEKLETWGRVIAIFFARDRNCAKRFKNCQEAEQIAATLNVGGRLTVEPE
jgi:hypothetical protein